MSSKLKTALSSTRLVRVFALGQICHPKLVEMIAWIGGYDAVWFDQEHAGLTIAQIEDGTRAARAGGLDTFVRLTATDYATVMRCLEAGAGGLMAAMIRSVDQVRDVVRWARFHPQGMRGINGAGVDGRYGMLPFADYIAGANDNIVVGVQIEHFDAVEAIDEIVQVPGLDFVFIGPADLSQSMGIPAQWDHPRLWQAFERVATASAASGVPWAIMPLNPAFGKRCLEMGCRMMSLGLDVWAFRQGVQATKDTYAEFFAG
jgi:2-keto-3-deoxy-L-rhamnonate aldolase RhmA